MFESPMKALEFLDQIASMAAVPRQQHAMAQEAAKIIATKIAPQHESESEKKAA